MILKYSEAVKYMRTIAILKECTKDEKAMILSACTSEDRVLFFDSEEAMLQSGHREDIEVIFGEPEVSAVNSLPALRWVQMSWAGANKYTSDPAYPAHVRLTSASGAFGGVISEHIIAGVLALYKNLRAYESQLKNGGWQLLSGDESLEGKRALVLGVGDIGSHTAKKLKAFGASTTGICRTERDRLPEGFDMCCTLSGLDEQLKTADLVISTLPGTPLTRRLLDRERIAKIQPNAIVVNVGRGFVIDTEALTQALQTGRLKGAVLDVTDPEPLPKEHPLRSMSNVILTPHVSGISWGENVCTRKKIIGIFADNIKKDAQNAPLSHLIDLTEGY